MLDNIKSYMNRNLFHFINGCQTRKGGLRAENAIIYNPTSTLISMCICVFTQINFQK